MSRHLTSQQISEWIAGERNPQPERHVRECSECRAELARMEAALSLFRGSVRHWSDRQSLAEPPAIASLLPSPSRVRPLRWALVAAALLVLAAVPVYRNAQSSERQAEQARADALLEQVDAEVSRAVPRPMEPLAKLVSWDFDSTDGRDQNRRDTTNKEIR